VEFIVCFDFLDLVFFFYTKHIEVEIVRRNFLKFLIEITGSSFWAAIAVLDIINIVVLLPVAEGVWIPVKLWVLS